MCFFGKIQICSFCSFQRFAWTGWSIFESQQKTTRSTRSIFHCDPFFTRSMRSKFSRDLDRAIHFWIPTKNYQIQAIQFSIRSIFLQDPCDPVFNPIHFFTRSMRSKIWGVLDRAIRISKRSKNQTIQTIQESCDPTIFSLDPKFGPGDLKKIQNLDRVDPDLRLCILSHFLLQIFNKPNSVPF